MQPAGLLPALSLSGWASSAETNVVIRTKFTHSTQSRNGRKKQEVLLMSSGAHTSQQGEATGHGSSARAVKNQGARPLIDDSRHRSKRLRG
jgi:hypothetical protein